MDVPFGAVHRDRLVQAGGQAIGEEGRLDGYGEQEVRANVASAATEVPSRVLKSESILVLGLVVETDGLR